MHPGGLPGQLVGSQGTALTSFFDTVVRQLKSGTSETFCSQNFFFFFLLRNHDFLVAVQI